ncbi:hypothetical protein PR202_ga17191 [Eleusine coracana subsp. coracana]|uniref:DUF1618 domain-containing protein n=1 Tax=Eleusine coracana subsp. coracana TaxID=191504 RepID=A0AAV5CQ65_ELECO|nr:hypothetical protein PR202_ga17191 [Eleusine coracana subsp. coracana]
MFGFFGRNTDASPAPTFKVFCKADEGRCLAVRDGALVLAAADPGDEHQHWTKDVRYSRVIKDEEGHPIFCLVNKASGLAVQRSFGPGYPVGLTRFYPDAFDESVLWTESVDLRKAFGCIRMIYDVHACLDASLDGAAVVLTDVEGDSRSDGQQWKTADEGFSITVRDGVVCLAPTDPGDEYQHWIVDKRPHMIRDIDGSPAFVLVNKDLKLKPYNPNFPDISVLWATSWDMGQGFKCIHMVDNDSLNFDAFQDVKDDGGVCDNVSLDFDNLSLAVQGGKDHCELAWWFSAGVALRQRSSGGGAAAEVARVRLGAAEVGWG